MQNFPDSPFARSRSNVDRREGPRYTFLALMELTDHEGVMCIEGRLREIARDEETFTSNGTVVYVHDGIGMGVVFVDTTKDQLEMLHSWLAGLAHTEML